MSANILEEIINAISELNRMQQLNFELLEQLNVTCEYLLKNYPHLPNNEKLASLLSKALTLFEEITSNPLSDEILQRKKSDEDFTEPALKVHAVRLACFQRIANHKINNPLVNAIALHQQKRHKTQT